MQDNVAERFFRDLGWTSLGMGTALLIDFFLFILLGRILGPEQFGIFGVFLSIYYILVRAPFDSLEMTAKKIQIDTGDAFEQLGRNTFLLGLGVFLALVIFSGPITTYLDLPLKAFLVFSLTFPLAYITAVLMSVIQARQNFKQYAVYESVSSVAKFSVIIPTVFIGLTAAVSAYAIEIVVGFAIIYIFYFKPGKTGKGFEALDELKRSLIYVLALNAAISVDIILLKFLATAETVGFYNSVAVLGKGLFFGAIAVNRAVFPKFNGGSNKIRLLFLVGLALAIQGIVAYTIFDLFGSQIMSLSFGQEYVEAASFTSLYMVFITLLSGCGALGNYYLSTGRKNLRRIMLLPIIQAGLILTFLNSGPEEVITAGIVASSIVLVLMILPVLRDIKEN